MSFPYTPRQASIPPFLDHIAKDGVPDKVTQQHLAASGFKSKNDRPLIPLFQALGFIDGAGKPTIRWSAYRNKAQARGVLAEGVREGYSNLFKFYPDAHRKDNEALANYFKSHSSFSDATVGVVVRTFKTLSDRADFESLPAQEVPGIGNAMPNTEGYSPAPVTKVFEGAGAPVININIQLEIPATDDDATYDKLFAAMRRHLFDVSSST